MIKIRNAVLLGWLFATVGQNAQTLKLDDCYTKAEANFPLVKAFMGHKTKCHNFMRSGKRRKVAVHGRERIVS